MTDLVERMPVERGRALWDGVLPGQGLARWTASSRLLDTKGRCAGAGRIKLSEILETTCASARR